MHKAPLYAVLTMVVSCAGREPITPLAPHRSTGAEVDRRTLADDGPTTVLRSDGQTAADGPHLENLIRITDRIYTGGEPREGQAFAQLARLGVRTVVSVDGARPNMAAAERHGLRYVHIPIGYDGISDNAGKSLARLVKEAEAPFYIHCHHGKHRGPAAAAVACIADGATDGDSALAILEAAGTSTAYAGLWRDVEHYSLPANDAVLPELVPVAEVSSLAAAMAQIDRAAENLELCQTLDWQTPPAHPDIVPAHEVLLLKEGLRETVRRLVQSDDYDEQFATWMREAEGTAAALQSALNNDDTDAARKTFTALQNQCQRCHGAYRD